MSPTAKVYSGPITLAQTTQINARVLYGTTWSALNDAWFIVAPATQSTGCPAAAGNLAITEINYNPVGPTAAELAVNPGFKGDDFQFMELQEHRQPDDRPDGRAIDARLHAGVQLQRTRSTGCPGRDDVAPGAYVLIVQNPQAFAARYGAELQALYGADWQALLVAGEFTQKLAAWRRTGPLDGPSGQHDRRFHLQQRRGVAGPPRRQRQHAGNHQSHRRPHQPQQLAVQPGRQRFAGGRRHPGSRRCDQRSRSQHRLAQLRLDRAL